MTMTRKQDRTPGLIVSYVFLILHFVCSSSNSDRSDISEIYRRSDRNSSFVAYNITFAGKKIPKENIVLDGCYTDDNQYCS